MNVISEADNKKGRFLSFLSKLTYPFCYELPYICLFVIMMAAHSSFINNLRSYKDTALLFLFAYIGAAIISSIKSRRSRIAVKTVFYIFPLILKVISVFLFSNFYMQINATCITLLAETTSSESTEFIKQYILSSAIIPTLQNLALNILAIIIFEALWYYVKKRLKVVPRFCMIASLFAVIPGLLIGIYRTRAYYDIYNVESAEEVEFNSPRDPISSIYTSFITIKKMGEGLQKYVQKSKQSYNDEAFTTAEQPINIVVVIGESYIKHHSWLYGYPLETTPHLSAEKDSGRLFLFNDVISSVNTTSLAMKNILCCNNSSDRELWYNYPNFLSIFKKAGYNVYYWDNQLDSDKGTTYTFTLNSFLFHPELYEQTYTRVNNKSFKYDKGLIDSFNDEVELSADDNNLILLHLMGQHHDAFRRFPEEGFSLFTADSIKRDEPYLDEEKKAYIASYDNATLYNDYVLKEIFDTFKESNTVLIYFSDHGEEVYSYRKRYGRDHGPMNAKKLKYQYEVPFMVWCSDEFMYRNPATVAAIQGAVDRPFLTDNLCNMLFNLGSINTIYYRDSLDLISPNYKSKQRLIENNCIYEQVRYSKKN